MIATYACSGYPSAGTITVGFDPVDVVQIQNSSIAVTGTFWQATQPISGTVTANAGSGTFNVSAAQSGTWTMQPGNTANTTPWLVTGTGGTFPVTGTFWPYTLGQQVAASSVPVILPSATIATLTPPAAITNFSLETGGNLATLAGAINASVVQNNTKQINGVAPSMGNGVSGTGVQRVTLASDSTGQVAVTGTVTVAGTVTTTPPSHASTNVDQLNGTTTDTNSGTKSAGTLRVVIATDQPQLTNKLLVTPDANSSVNLSQVGGSSTATAASGVAKVGIVGNTGAVVDAVPGSAVPANAIQIEGTDGTNGVVPYIDPCQRGARSQYIVNLTSSTRIITGTSAKKTYLCSVDIGPIGTATNVALVEGTGSTCGTSTTGMSGGSTAANGWNFSATGGSRYGSGGFWLYVTATAADDVCLLLSASNQISGNITYVQY